MARITVLDDSRLARSFAAGALRLQGHQITELDPTSVFDVLKALREGRAPDVLVMDFLMPKCPGESLIRACCEDERLRGMRILVLTAHRDEPTLRRLEALGIHHFLFKPVDPVTLSEVVKDMLNG